MSYRKPFEEALDSMQNDIETVKDELENILDIDNIIWLPTILAILVIIFILHIGR